MNVCLIYPTLENWEPWPPLGLAYIAAFVREKCDNIIILDRNVLLKNNNGNLKKTNSATIEVLKEFKPDIVGITATTVLIPDAYNMAHTCKTLFPHVVTILGGTHATVLPEETLNECPDLDYICIGEGENVFDQIVSLKDKKDIRQLKGIAYLDNHGNVINNGFAPFIENLDILPFPARDLIDMKRYMVTANNIIRGVNIRATHIFGARGCPFKCKFCASSKVFGPKVRFHSPQYILNEIKLLKKEYGVDGIYFAEDMFLSNKQRTLGLCDLLKKEGLNKSIEWCAQLKVNVIDQFLLTQLKEAGCIQIEYGFESGSDRVLNLMNKKATVSANFEADSLTRESKIRYLANIIVGIPDENEEDYLGTIQFVKKIKADYIAFNKFIPLPGSRFYDELKEKGLLTNDWESYWTTNLNYNFANTPRKKFILFYLLTRFFIMIRNKANYYFYNISTKRMTLKDAVLDVLKNPTSKLKNASGIIKRIVSSFF